MHVGLKHVHKRLPVQHFWPPRLDRLVELRLPMLVKDVISGRVATK